MPSGAAQATIASSFIVRPEWEEEGEQHSQAPPGRGVPVPVGEEPERVPVPVPEPFAEAVATDGLFGLPTPSNHSGEGGVSGDEASVGKGSPMSKTYGKRDTGQTVNKIKKR